MVQQNPELFFKENIVILIAVDITQRLPCLTEIDVEPTLGERETAINSLALDKSLVSGGIPPDFGSTLLSPIH